MRKGAEDSFMVSPSFLTGPATADVGGTDAASTTVLIVAAYCARHTKQESHMLDEKSDEELEKTKSVRSVSSSWPLPPCALDSS